MTLRIFLKLLAGVTAILLVALGVADFLVSRTAYQTLLEARRRELAEKSRALAHLAAGDLQSLSRGEITRLARSAGVRLTVVRADGVVLADSEQAPERMDNHRGRPEVIQALRHGEGSSARVSPTLGLEMLYYAVRIPAGVLRLAVPVADIKEQVRALRREILASMVLALLPAMLLAAVLARSVSSRMSAIIQHAGRLAQGDFRSRLGWKGKGELAVLAQKLDETAHKLQGLFEEQRREHEELKKLERIRKDFVINVSHELRTPLASIQGYAETLLDGALADPEYNVRFLTIIRQNAERLNNLVNDLLTLSRIELNQREYHFALYRMNELVKSTVDSMRPMAQKKNLELNFLPAETELEAFCDEAAVHQALGNLLDNAIKYTPEGGKVEVRTRPYRDQGRDYVEITVSDTGPGIPREDLPRIFERFYRVDKARSRALGGTGLGLSIVKHLVQAHGGEVWVESELGQGTTFGIRLPVEGPGLEPPVKEVSEAATEN